MFKEFANRRRVRAVEALILRLNPFTNIRPHKCGRI
jgi:hypothetical protein